MDAEEKFATCKAPACLSITSTCAYRSSEAKNIRTRNPSDNDMLQLTGEIDSGMMGHGFGMTVNMEKSRCPLV
jgi:hypothetical protein